MLCDFVESSIEDSHFSWETTELLEIPSKTSSMPLAPTKSCWSVFKGNLTLFRADGGELVDRGVSAVSVPRSFVSNVKKKYISHSG